MSLLENIMTNIYQTNTGMKPTKGNGENVSASSDPAALTKALLSELKADASTIVRGEVLDLRQNQILLKLLTGESINARTDRALPLSIGDIADFIVTANDGKLITLKLAESEGNDSEFGKDRLIEGILKNTNIHSDECAVNVVKELLNHSQSVSDANIRKFITLSHRFPETDIRNLVLMDINKIPVTQENVRLFSDFNNNAARLIPELANAINEIQTAVSETENPELRAGFLKELADIVSEAVVSVTNTASSSGNNEVIPSIDSAAIPVSDNSGLPADNENPIIPEAKQSLTESSVIDASLKSAQNTSVGPDSEAEANISAYFATDDDHEDAPRSVLSDSRPENKNLTSESLSELRTILSEAGVKPEAFSKETVKKFYDRIKNVSGKLEKLASRIQAQQVTADTSRSLPGDRDNLTGKPFSHTDNLNSTMKFIDIVNDVFPYIQLPVKLKEENAHGELYVYEKKKTLRDSENLSALLHLELDNLGPTDIYVKLSGTSVYTSFSVSDDIAGKIFSEEMPSLSEALSKRGYSLSSDISLRNKNDEKPPLLTEFLESHSPSSVSRYSFDMRA